MNHTTFRVSYVYLGDTFSNQTERLLRSLAVTMEVKSLELKCFGEINDVLRTRAEIKIGRAHV